MSPINQYNRLSSKKDAKIAQKHAFVKGIKGLNASF